MRIIHISDNVFYQILDDGFEMARFESIFGMPAGHVLKQTGFRSRRGDQDNSWTHEEFDATGRLVARYESWANTTFFGSPVSEGWMKYDPAGVLVASGTELPL